jgi:hypothetical protein
MPADSRAAGRETGLTLVELMVSIVVGLLLIAGVIQVYLSSKQSYNAQVQLARMQETGRFATDLITRDLRRAGYWGGNADLSTFVGNPGPAVPAHACGSDNSWARMIERRVSGRNGTNAGYNCAIDYRAGTDILTVRYAGPERLAAAALQPNGLYLSSTIVLGWVLTGALAADGDNAAPAEITGGPEHLRPVLRAINSHAYYIATPTDARSSCRGQPIPELRRARLNPASGQLINETIASGVEQLQVQYLLGNQYVNADAIADADWRDVAAVRVWLLVRGDCPEPGLGNTNQYVMGDVTITAADDFRRQLYVSTVMLRNNIVR